MMSGGVHASLGLLLFSPGGLNMLSPRYSWRVDESGRARLVLPVSCPVGDKPVKNTLLWKKSERGLSPLPPLRRG